MLDDVWNQQQVRHRLRELADADPQLRRFGARQHRYQLGRTVSAEDLTRFEQDNGVTLPDAYREFITTVGDGGAGPYLGMYRHDGTDWDNPNYPPEERRPGFLATAFPHTERFQPYRPGLSDDDILYDPSWLSGSLVLAAYGCGAYFRLVVTGDARGQVWFDDFASDEGLSPGPDFHDWYQAWLDDPELGAQ